MLAQRVIDNKLSDHQDSFYSAHNYCGTKSASTVGTGDAADEVTTPT
jgi:hypothetical protein